MKGCLKNRLNQLRFKLLPDLSNGSFSSQGPFGRRSEASNRIAGDESTDK